MKYLSIVRATLRNEYINLASTFRSPSKSIHILNSHFCSASIIRDVNLFGNFLDNLQEMGEIIDFDKAVMRVLTNNLIVDKPIFALSFDDGFIDCYDSIFPELCSRKLKAGFFINSNLVEGVGNSFNDACSRIETRGKGFMDWSMIKEMSKNGQIIGSHGSSHIRPIEASEEIFKQDVIINHNKIFDNLGFYPKFYAWPYGRNSDISFHQINFLSDYYQYILGGESSIFYTSFSGKVVNRRHVEPFWTSKHINYFVSHEKFCNPY